MTGIQACFDINWPGFELNVDISLPEKGITALFGPSGSGKTTLLRCIAGLERAPKGQLTVSGVTWQDNDHWLPTYRRPLGYVFQEASLFPHLTVLGNLQFGMRRAGIHSTQKLNPIIEMLGIGHLLQRRPDKLSGGERQRVGIARALAVDPQLLLMDEPLAALDFQRKQEILPYLERLRDELQIPVLYVSHAPAEVMRLADHLVVMQQGQVKACGNLTDVLADLDQPLFLGEEAGVVIDSIVGEIQPEWHLMRTDFPGGSLWLRSHDVAVGSKVRVLVQARDVSLALTLGNSSIQNVFAGQVDALGDDEHPGLLLVRVRVGETIFLARLTKRSAAALNVQPGQTIWVQVKSVALQE